MAKLTDDLMQETLNAHLQEGEALKHWAFGIKQPNILLMVPLFALAIVPGVIATQMLTKNYLIGLTDKRLIVLEVKSITNVELKTLTEYALGELKGSYKPGKIFTHISLESAEKPFKAKFHRMFSKGNRAHAVAIGEVVAAA